MQAALCLNAAACPQLSPSVPCPSGLRPFAPSWRLPSSAACGPGAAAAYPQLCRGRAGPWRLVGTAVIWLVLGIVLRHRGGQEAECAGMVSSGAELKGHTACRTDKTGVWPGMDPQPSAANLWVSYSHATLPTLQNPSLCLCPCHLLSNPRGAGCSELTRHVQPTLLEPKFQNSAPHASQADQSRHSCNSYETQAPRSSRLQAKLEMQPHLALVGHHAPVQPWALALLLTSRTPGWAWQPCRPSRCGLGP